MSKWALIEVILVLLVVAASAGGYIYITYYNGNKLILSDQREMEELLKPFSQSSGTSTQPTQPTSTSSNPTSDEIIATRGGDTPAGTSTTTATSSATSTRPAPTLVSSKLASSSPTTAQAWSVFQSFMTALKAKDMAAVAKVSHLEMPCASQQECNGLYDFMAKFIGEQKLSNYIYIDEDAKQVILSSAPRYSTSSGNKGYAKDYIYFVKVNGAIKFLTIEPNRSWYHTTQFTNSSPDVIEKSLQAMMLDSDKDGLTDMQERCEGSSSANPDCKKTDPNRKDTDNDGWWDGIESKFDPA